MAEPSSFARTPDEPCASVGPRIGSLLGSPWSRTSLPHPGERCSGLFPAFDPLDPALDAGPRPVARSALRLRRAVLLTVVVGATSLLAYASWQRAAHARPATNAVASR